jgi:hypothetical protein
LIRINPAPRGDRRQGRNLPLPRAFPLQPDGPETDFEEATMGRGLLLWLIGIPLPIILIVWLLGGLS